MLGTTLGDVYGISIGTYDVTVLILEGSTEGIAEGKFEGLLLGAWIGYLNRLEIVTDDGNTLWLLYGKLFGATLGALDGSQIGTYGGTKLGSLDGSTEGITEGNLDGLLLGAWLALDVIYLGTDDSNEPWFWYGKSFGTKNMMAQY